MGFNTPLRALPLEDKKQAESSIYCLVDTRLSVSSLIWYGLFDPMKRLPPAPRAGTRTCENKPAGSCVEAGNSSGTKHPPLRRLATPTEASFSHPSGLLVCLPVSRFYCAIESFHYLVFLSLRRVAYCIRPDGGGFLSGLQAGRDGATGGDGRSFCRLTCR